MSKKIEYLWVGRTTIILTYCFGVFWIFAILTDLQTLFDTTAEVYKDGKGHLFGYALAKIVLPPLFIFSPFIIMSIAEYITGLKFEQSTNEPEWLKDIDSFWLGASIFLIFPVIIYNLIFRNFIDVPRAFGYLHIICFLHLWISIVPLLFLSPSIKNKPNSSH